ncbi:glycosyltransferase family 8 protein [Polychaeton citri CBS 116435]|uniref:Glycosyltransferase family 8 protein n=1 Tax=Polychaeton citri CBS 116435 TaxID=1314669 RepID=A0A9P4UUW9_9PEZI|nr:glycosyltransferase family 8 protein [Polychaeton citri CBS 116435]
MDRYWREKLSSVVSLTGGKLQGSLPAWGNASVENEPWSGRSLSQNIRDYVCSKVFWRFMTVAAVFLFLFDVFQAPAKSYVGKYVPNAISNWQEVKPPTLPDESTTDHTASYGSDPIDWSQYAYCQYVTNEDYLCNSLMIFESLTRLGAKASKVMMYPYEWDLSAGDSKAQLLLQARDRYGVALSPVEVQHFEGEPTWADSFTKLLAFNQTQYKRVLSLDSDSTVLQPMDELFLMPSAPVAMPRAYWLEDTLSSQLVLVEPSQFEFKRIKDAFESRTDADYDMEIVNQLYGDDCIIIPHRKYDLLTGELRVKDRKEGHVNYLGSKEEVWDSDRILKETKFIHFSDWPYPKPWLPAQDEETSTVQPECHEVQAADGRTATDCSDQRNWLWVYRDFRERRERVCSS